MYRSFLRGLVLCIGGFLFATSALAFVSPGVPEGFVNDYADVLSAATEKRLEERLAAFETKTQQEVAVVTVPTTGDESIEQYAVELFEDWGIGKAGQDNGVMLVLAVQDRKLRIEVGYGLEGILTDARSAQIITNAKPQLQASNFSDAVDQLTDQMIQVLETNEAIPMRRPSSNPWVLLAIFIGMVGPLGLISFFVIRSSKKWEKEFDRDFKKEWGNMSDKLKNVQPTVRSPQQKDSLYSKPASGRARSRSSSSSSSRSSFGGGRSGGGGASGSW